MAAYSVTGTGPGSALKAGQKGGEDMYLGVERLIGTKIMFAGTVTMTASTTAVSFSNTLPGVATDYIVIANAAHLCYATALTTTGFTMNGTNADVVSYIVVRVNNATVTVDVPFNEWV